MSSEDEVSQHRRRRVVQDVVYSNTVDWRDYHNVSNQKENETNRVDYRKNSQ